MRKLKRTAKERDNLINNIVYADRVRAKEAMRRAMTIWEKDRKSRKKEWPGLEIETS